MGQGKWAPEKYRGGTPSARLVRVYALGHGKQREDVFGSSSGRAGRTGGRHAFFGTKYFGGGLRSVAV